MLHSSYRGQRSWPDGALKKPLHRCNHGDCRRMWGSPYCRRRCLRCWHGDGCRRGAHIRRYSCCRDDWPTSLRWDAQDDGHLDDSANSKVCSSRDNNRDPIRDPMKVPKTGCSRDPIPMSMRVPNMRDMPDPSSRPMRVPSPTTVPSSTTLTSAVPSSSNSCSGNSTPARKRVCPHC